MPHDIFISYSRRDLAAVKPIKEELEAQGFSCWMDLEGIESGSEEFTNHLVKAIKAAKCFLFFLSASSQKSKWSLKEIRYATEQNKRVVIVRINDCALTDAFSFSYGGDDIIDWRVPEQKEKLLRDLSRWAEKKKPRQRRTARRSEKAPSSMVVESPQQGKPPISISFKYYKPDDIISVVMPIFGLGKKLLGLGESKFYVLEIENHHVGPIEVSIAVKNNARRASFKKTIAGHSTEDFRTLGGRWRFTYGDRGKISVTGYPKALEFGLDEDGYWPAPET